MQISSEPTKAEYKPYMQPFTEYTSKPALGAAITGIALGTIIFLGGIALVVALATDFYVPEMNQDLFLTLTGSTLGIGLIGIVAGGRYIQYVKADQEVAAITAFRNAQVV